MKHLKDTLTTCASQRDVNGSAYTQVQASPSCRRARLMEAQGHAFPTSSSVMGQVDLGVTRDGAANCVAARDGRGYGAPRWRRLPRAGALPAVSSPVQLH
jgi:hypothetical protein